MRPTSSTRSSFTETSLVARQEGTVTEKTPGACAGDAECQALQDVAHFIGS